MPMTKTALLAKNLDNRFSYAAPHKVHETISEWLGYMKIGRDWRFVALDNDLTSECVVGPIYGTKRALLADMARYIRESGY
jgi:hypothetical protein